MEDATNKQNIERLLVAVQELSLARNLESVIRIVRGAARALSGADGVTFILRRNDRCHYVDEDAIGPLWKGQDFPIDKCISGWAMKHHQTVVIEDIYADDRIPHDLYRPTFVKSLLMVPIRTVDPIGVIGSYWAQKHVPTTDEIRLLQALANSTMVTLENINVNNELEQRVNNRTAELEASNRALEAFSYSVSHDLRAPLRKIGYFTELLAETYQGQLGDKGNEWLEKLQGQAREMTNLIDVLLEFSRTGRKAPEKTQVHMTAMVEELVRHTGDHENGHRVRFTVHRLPDAPADIDLIRQVWVNLISNAIKYSSKKTEAQIEIGAEEIPGAVVYYVKDNGVGFDMNYVSKLFSPFQRLHSRNDFEGTGIGLATAERIIARHNGKIWAEAVPEEGACFYFQLPM